TRVARSRLAAEARPFAHSASPSLAVPGPAERPARSVPTVPGQRASGSPSVFCTASRARAARTRKWRLGAAEDWPLVRTRSRRTPGHSPHGKQHDGRHAMRGSTFPTGIAKRIAAFAIAILSLVAIEAGLAGGATAAVAPDCAATPAGGNLCVLSPSAASALNLGGGSTLTVAKNIVVNSSSANAATATGGATASATAIGGPGGFVPTASFSPTPVSVAAQADPYSGASVTHGSCSGGDSAIVLSGSQTAAPGTYASLGAGSGGTLSLAPGTYTITGSFTNVSGGTITGNGVTLYFCPGAGLSLSGASSTTLSSPTGASGFVLFFDPSSTGTFSALADTARFTGIVYAKSAALQLNAFDVQGDVVADTVDIHSGGAVHITSGSTPPPPPPQKTTPTLTTTASGPVTVGTSIHDTAHLSGGSNPTGAITFDLYDSTCTTKLTTVAATTSVNGNGDYVSAGYTPSAAGTYKWAAHYSGDANNNGVDVACGA